MLCSFDERCMRAVTCNQRWFETPGKQTNKNEQCVCVAWREACFKPGQNYERVSVLNNNYSNKHDDETSYQAEQEEVPPFNMCLCASDVAHP